MTDFLFCVINKTLPILSYSIGDKTKASTYKCLLINEIIYLQESKNRISQYLTSPFPKNKNDYIPGTNIRKDSIKNDTAKSGETSFSGISEFNDFSNSFLDDSEVLEKSFMDDNEGDELLAKLDL